MIQCISHQLLTNLLRERLLVQTFNLQVPTRQFAAPKRWSTEDCSDAAARVLLQNMQASTEFSVVLADCLHLEVAVGVSQQLVADPSIYYVGDTHKSQHVGAASEAPECLQKRGKLLILIKRGRQGSQKQLLHGGVILARLGVEQCLLNLFVEGERVWGELMGEEQVGIDVRETLAEVEVSGMIEMGGLHVHGIVSPRDFGVDWPRGSPLSKWGTDQSSPSGGVYVEYHTRDALLVVAAQKVPQEGQVVSAGVVLLQNHQLPFPHTPLQNYIQVRVPKHSPERPRRLLLLLERRFHYQINITAFYPFSSSFFSQP